VQAKQSLEALFNKGGNHCKVQSSNHQTSLCTLQLIHQDKAMKSKRDAKKLLSSTITALAIVLMPLTMQAQQQGGDRTIQNAVAAGIDEARAGELYNRAMARGITEEQFSELLQPAITMAGENLPYELILEKAFEGISKGVAHSQMMPILNSLSENAAVASGFIDAWAGRPEISDMLGRHGSRMNDVEFRKEMVKAASKGLVQGFDRDVMNDVLNRMAAGESLQKATPAGLITAISVLSDLPSSGHEPAESARIVLAALESGFEADDLQKLPGAIAMAQRRTQLPAQAIAGKLEGQLGIGLPASQVLQNLFNGNIGNGPGNAIPPRARSNMKVPSGSQVL
jgi:hypothetical protein